jgi:hypothetical protein
VSARRLFCLLSSIFDLVCAALIFHETGPEGPELEGQQEEINSKAAQTEPKKLIRRTCHMSEISSCSCWGRNYSLTGGKKK